MRDGGRFTQKSHYPLCWPLVCLFCLMAIPVLTSELQLNEQSLRQAEHKYGPDSRQRLEAWQNLLRQEATGDDRTKLEQVNRFFNRIPFIEDAIHWQQNDYWATPFEFLASGGGDCEDFAIAKYFTLVSLGVDENKLTLTYVKALNLNQAHMVLAYYAAPAAEPLILDSLNASIEPSSKRTDLLPVYSLNASGLWLAKQRGKGKLIGESSRLQRWQDLLERMTDEFNHPKEKP